MKKIKRFFRWFALECPLVPLLMGTTIFCALNTAMAATVAYEKAVFMTLPVLLLVILPLWTWRFYEMGYRNGRWSTQEYYRKLFKYRGDVP